MSTPYMCGSDQMASRIALRSVSAHDVGRAGNLVLPPIGQEPRGGEVPLGTQVVTPRVIPDAELDTRPGRRAVEREVPRVAHTPGLFDGDDNVLEAHKSRVNGLDDLQAAGGVRVADKCLAVTDGGLRDFGILHGERPRRVVMHCRRS